MKEVKEKKQHGGVKKHSLQVYLTKEELDIIDKLAEEKQVRRSALAREILINALRFVKL